MVIVGEIAQGSGTTFTLANAPVLNSQAVYGSGVRLTEGNGNDYTIAGGIITILNGSYAAGQVLVDYLTTTSPLVQVGNDILSPLALTTLQRVKDILFDPNKTISLSGCTLIANSTDVTGVTVPVGKTITVGQTISGTGIPLGTTISAIISATEITLSQAAASNQTGQILFVIDQPTAYDGMLIRYINGATNYVNNACGRFSFVQQSYVNDTYSISNPRQSYLKLRNFPLFSISSFEWRAGTPSNPNWTPFIPDQFEPIDPRTDPISGQTFYESGIIRVYGVLPRIYNNMIRCSYIAGYPVNWANAEDHNLHWLPGDITVLCENLVVRRFKRRQMAGKTSEALEGATISWARDLDQEDRDTIGQYLDIKF